MIGHLGSRVTSLLDGQLPPAEEERAWDHVHGCHPCRDAVEREGWVKTRLAMLAPLGSQTPSGLRESLLGAPFAPTPDSTAPLPPSGGADGGADGATSSVRARHLLALGGGALSFAVMGVIALSGPANAPQVDRRGPVTSVSPVFQTSEGRSVLLVPSRPTATATVRREAVREKMAQ